MTAMPGTQDGRGDSRDWQTPVIRPNSPTTRVWSSSIWTSGICTATSWNRKGKCSSEHRPWSDKIWMLSSPLILPPWGKNTSQKPCRNYWIYALMLSRLKVSQALLRNVALGNPPAWSWEAEDSSGKIADFEVHWGDIPAYSGITETHTGTGKCGGRGTEQERKTEPQ